MLDLISPPAGAHLISAVGDVGGFVHHDFANPGLMFANPTFGSTTSLDFAELAPGGHRAGRQPDGGDAASASPPTAARPGPRRPPQPAGVTGGGTVAVNADGTRVGLVAGRRGGAPARPTAARPGRACAGRAGRRARSSRTGSTRRASTRSPPGSSTSAPTAARPSRRPAATGLPAEGNVRFKAVPGRRRRHLARRRQDRRRCTGCGAPPTAAPRSPGWPAWTRPTTSASARPAPRPARTRRCSPAPRSRGVRGIFRSDDAGRRWIRINDDRHQYAWTGRRDHRRPAGLRPGLRGHQRPRHHRRRTPLTAVHVAQPPAHPPRPAPPPAPSIMDISG